MTIATTQSEQPSGWTSNRGAKIIGYVFASMSLLICLMFWFEFFYAYAVETPLWGFTGLRELGIMAVAVTFAGIATALRSKLWRLALPVALIMFHFVMYVMGT